jgi:hypothetical protein
VYVDVDAHLAAEAAPALTTKRCRRVIDVVGADPDGARLKLSRHLSALDIPNQTAAGRMSCRWPANRFDVGELDRREHRSGFSRAIVISGVTPSKIVGCRSSLCGADVGALAAATTVAPSSGDIDIAQIGFELFWATAPSLPRIQRIARAIFLARAASFSMNSF